MLRNHPFNPQEISSSFGRIHSKYFSWCAGIALAAAGLCHADDFSAQRQLVENLARLTEAPAMREADGFPAAAEIKAIYGCGDLSMAGNQYGRALGDNLLYQQVWDPLLRLDRAKLPVLWLSWPQDKHFPLDRQAASYRRAPGPHMVTLVPNMGHGHGPAWKRPESYAFAESIVREKSPWCVQTTAGADGKTARASFTSSKPLDRATLVSTTGSGITGSRAWLESPAKLEEKRGRWHATATLSEGTTAWFINVHSGALVSSSDFQETSAPSQSIPVNPPVR